MANSCDRRMVTSMDDGRRLGARCEAWTTGEPSAVVELAPLARLGSRRWYRSRRAG